MSAKLQEVKRDQTKRAVTIALNVIYRLIRNRGRNFANFQFIQKFSCEPSKCF